MFKIVKAMQDSFIALEFQIKETKNIGENTGGRWLLKSSSAQQGVAQR